MSPAWSKSSRFD